MEEVLCSDCKKVYCKEYVFIDDNSNDCEGVCMDCIASISKMTEQANISSKEYRPIKKFRYN